MKSIITSKYQTTIPKEVRRFLGVAVKDAIEWRMEKGKVFVYPVKRDFLGYRNSVNVGPGDTTRDIEAARKRRLEKYM
jgi:bifunctional DNA-binding transcriptional regulator/antitoxin component of YhaV-PrlF toxin-antitoxin module